MLARSCRARRSGTKGRRVELRLARDACADPSSHEPVGFAEENSLCAIASTAACRLAFQRVVLACGLRARGLRRLPEIGQMLSGVADDPGMSVAHSWDMNTTQKA